MPWVIAHTATNNVFCFLTVFGAVFLMFLDELGLPKTQMGLLLSLFPFCGLLALFVAPAVARFGLKRTYLTFWTLRKFVAALLLFTPWVLERWGLDVTFFFVAGILLVFAVCRAIAETALYPWYHEIVPDSIRGKFSAASSIVGTLTAMLTLGTAGYVIGRGGGLRSFVWLMAVGVVFGLVSVWCQFFVPGGAPNPKRREQTAHLRQMLTALRDSNLRHYLGGVGLSALTVALLGFVPLFLKEEVGLDPGMVVVLQNGALLGGVISGALWGWAADRFGSKPVMLSGLHVMAVLPLCWLVFPRHSAWSVPLAMGLAFFSGLINYAWAIGSGRLLYVSIVPPEKKTEYMALYYAWVGLLGGIGSLFAGRLLDMCRGLRGNFGFIALDPYTPVFVLSSILLTCTIVLMRGIHVESSMRTRAFAGMFLQGNPFMAAETMFRFRLATQERTRVGITRRLGDAMSPLNVDELIEALADPSFNVRYEAIISIARTRPHERLIDALIAVLVGGTPDLSPAAAWALGRLGDERAVEPLRRALVSGYPLLEARSARALATLGDTQSASLVLDRFRNVRDSDLRLAYAAALGALRMSDALAELLAFLRATEEEGGRAELALAVATIVGSEETFIRLWRQMRGEFGTAGARAALALKKKAGKNEKELQDALEGCADALARNDAVGSAESLQDVMARVPEAETREACRIVLDECSERLKEHGGARREYILLALHAVNVALTCRCSRPRRAGDGG